jgi:hypothetical protein
MHRWKHKPDEEATKRKDYSNRASYVSFRIHPGSEPLHQCEYLAGDDKAVRRREIFERDGYRCVGCGERVTWETGEWAHGGNTKVSRCDCLENGKTKCFTCHQVREHGRFPRLGRIGIA